MGIIYLLFYKYSKGGHYNMNIIRIKMPYGVRRFEPFNVSQYRDFLLVSSDMKTNPNEEQTILDELLEELYPDVESVFREYVFLNVFTSSIGKTKIPLVFSCPDCGKEKKMLLNLAQKALQPISLEAGGLTINFKYVVPSDDFAQTFIDSIFSVSDGDNEFLWEELEDDVKENVIDSISFREFETVIQKMYTICVDHKVSCCNSHRIFYNRLLPIFKLILNPDELFTYYRINHLLTKSNYSFGDVMNMLPVERNIALTLVEKDLKEANQNAKNRIS